MYPFQRQNFCQSSAGEGKSSSVICFSRHSPSAAVASRKIKPSPLVAKTKGTSSRRAYSMPCCIPLPISCLLAFASITAKGMPGLWYSTMSADFTVLRAATLPRTMTLPSRSLTSCLICVVLSQPALRMAGITHLVMMSASVRLLRFSSAMGCSHLNAMRKFYTEK